MASWKYTLTLCIIAAISVSVYGRIKDKRLRGNRNSRDEVARGAVGRPTLIYTVVFPFQTVTILFLFK